MASSDDLPKHTYAPVDRGAVLLDYTATQAIVVAAALAAALALVYLLPVVPGLVAAGSVVVVAGLLALKRTDSRDVAEPRTYLEWIRPAARWVRRNGLRLHTVWTNPSPVQGFTANGYGWVEYRQDTPAPPNLSDVRVLQYTPTSVAYATGKVATGQRLGVAADAATGHYTSVIEIEGLNTQLADTAAILGKMSAWAETLNHAAAGELPITQVGWYSRSIPDDGSELWRDYQAGARRGERYDVANASYRELLEQGPRSASQLATYVAVSIDPLLLSSKRMRGKTVDAAACEAMWHTLRSLAVTFQDVGIKVLDDALTPERLSTLLRLLHDPTAGEGLGDEPKDRRTLPVGAAWPQMTRETFTHWQTDGALHRTFNVERWPTAPTYPDFLAPLLLDCGGVTRTVAVLMRPQPYADALDQVQRDVTNYEGAKLGDDENLRMETVRQGQLRQNAHTRRRHLENGDNQFWVSGWITASAPDEDALDDAAEEVTPAARRSGLRLRAMRGEQAAAHAYTLPVGRGVAAR